MNCATKTLFATAVLALVLTGTAVAQDQGGGATGSAQAPRERRQPPRKAAEPPREAPQAPRNGTSASPSRTSRLPGS